jgi:hypothetical protein
MTKEALILIVLVGAAAVGVMYVIRQASSNEGDWDEYRKVRLGESYSSVRAKFSAASEDLFTLSDARSAGCISVFKEATEAGAAKMFIVPSREDRFFFAFDKDGKLVYKSDRTPD